MKERMQKTLSQVNGCPQRDRSETEWLHGDASRHETSFYGGVQTFMWMCEDNIVEVPFDKEHLFEQILSPANLNRAYKAVMRNKGCGGIDKMSCEQLLPWLLTNKEELTRSLMDGSYRPNPVKRVEIPKGNGKMRLLGIPTVVDRLVQQAMNQVLTPIYEDQFSKRSYGFRPRRGCHDALRGAQRIINEGYIYVVDLERRGQPYPIFMLNDSLNVSFELKEDVKDARLFYLTTGHGGWGVVTSSTRSPTPFMSTVRRSSLSSHGVMIAAPTATGIPAQATSPTVSARPILAVPTGARAL